MLTYCERPAAAACCDPFPYIDPRYARETIAAICSLPAVLATAIISQTGSWSALPVCARKMACVIAALLMSANAVANPLASGQDTAQIERGRYLTAAGDCVACHSDPGTGRPFVGGRPIET